MIELLVQFFTNIGLVFYNLPYAITHPQLWLDWSDKQSIMRFVYFGASFELLFTVGVLFVILTALGIWNRQIMWSSVRIFEFVGNSVGRVAAWCGLLMVFQQVMIVFLQRIFRVSEISIGPFGYTISMDLSWYSEELKLYNAAVVCLCCGYTFIQGGHVRVDLFYSGVSYRTKKIIDMAGSLLFVLPSMCLIWLYAWYFLWRHLIVPKPSASDTLERLLLKARAVRWNVETIGFSPNGFNGYFLFKVLLVLFTALVLMQGIAFFYRSLLEWREGPESEDKYADLDRLDTPALPAEESQQGA